MLHFHQNLGRLCVHDIPTSDSVDVEEELCGGGGRTRSEVDVHAMVPTLENRNGPATIDNFKVAVAIVRFVPHSEFHGLVHLSKRLRGARERQEVVALFTE